MRVLLVEDDPRIANFVARGLREQAYAVDLAASGEDALYQASINTYDLAILDVMIPAPDGFEVCRRLRQSGLRFPILMLTARDATDDRVQGLDTGADDYLTKPFEFRELLARLRALLRRSGELRPSRIAVDDLVLDTAAQTATRGGKQIPLTTKEYALLEYLARHAGRVIGREEISEHAARRRIYARLSGAEWRCRRGRRRRIRRRGAWQHDPRRSARKNESQCHETGTGSAPGKEEACLIRCAFV